MPLFTMFTMLSRLTMPLAAAMMLVMLIVAATVAMPPMMVAVVSAVAAMMMNVSHIATTMAISPNI